MSGETQFNSISGYSLGNTYTIIIDPIGNVYANNLSVNGNSNFGSGTMSGNGYGLHNINGGNVTGAVANATYSVSAGTSGTVTTNAQPNITSVGTLSNLVISGNVTANVLLSESVVGNRANISLGAVSNTVVIDQFLASDYRVAKYVIKAGGDLGFQGIETLLVHDSINSNITIYGSITTTGNEIVTLTSSVTAGTVQLSATALSANITINVTSIYVTD